MLGDCMRRRRGRRGGGGRGRDQPSRQRLRWGRWLRSLLILLPLSFGTGYRLATIVLFPISETAANDLVVIPELIDRPLVEVERELAELGLELEETTELPHPIEEEGVVIAQSPVPGQRISPGAGARLAVSMGRARLQVPDLVGLSYETAASLAEDLGFTIMRREEEGPGTDDLVVRVEPTPGTMTELPATIVLVVNVIPEIELPEIDPDT